MKHKILPALLVSLALITAYGLAGDGLRADDRGIESLRHNFELTGQTVQRIQGGMEVFARELADQVGAGVASLAAAVDPGPATMTLDYNNAGQKVNNFTHQAHQAGLGSCQVCHHKDAPGTTPAKCFPCHGAAPSGAKPGIKSAYHAKCKGCHIKQGQGPTMCAGCHNR